MSHRNKLQSLVDREQVLNDSKRIYAVIYKRKCSACKMFKLNTEFGRGISLCRSCSCSKKTKK